MQRYDKVIGYYKQGKDYLSKSFFTFQLSAEFAVKARKKYPEKDILILGSLGPICESHQPGRFMKYLSEKGKLLLKIVFDNNKPFVVSS